MTTQTHTLGIDFGTSNTAAGYAVDGKPKLVKLAGDQTTMPTTFFFRFRQPQNADRGTREPSAA